MRFGLQQTLESQKRLLRPEWRETFVLLAGILYGKGQDVLHEFFEHVLEYGLAKTELADQARVVGLTGSMFNDFRVVNYSLSPVAEIVYATLRHNVLRIFLPSGAQDLSVKSRAEVADALGQAGDPRLQLPEAPQYSVRVGKLDFGRYPVTVHEYAKYVESGGPEPSGWEKQLKTPSRPVIGVSWNAPKPTARFGAREK